MGKSSTKYPSYTAGVVSIDGQQKASTSKKGNTVTTNYNMSDTERRIYDYARNSFADSLDKINVFDDDTQKQLQSQLDAYTAQGQKLINNIYTPLLSDLKTDVASRFGNYDNSVFLDKLNKIESNRSDAISSLSQDILAKRDELINNELANRYTYLTFLQDIENQINSNILNFVTASQQKSESGNNYSSQSYQSTKNQSSSGLFGFGATAATIASQWL